MRRPTPRRNALAVVAMTLLMVSLGVTVAVSAAAAKSPKKTNSLAARFFVINATVNAASIHAIGGSSAFPNFATGAVDNYYSLAHSHVDNSPFAQGTASPADTGPLGQTIAAGHFQQPQYADARWPGRDSGKATYGKEGEPYAAATASKYKATAEASLARRGLNGPSASTPIDIPKGFDGRLRSALAAWKAEWLDRLHPSATGNVPPPPAVTTPAATVTTPAATVTTPTVPVPVPTPTVPTPTVPTPTVPGSHTSAPSWSLASASTPKDGAFLLESSTLATLDPKTKRLVTSGESSLGRVSLGGGQIVIEGIHVSASIANNGKKPKHKIAVTVGAASIGGVPVTIDQDGVHVAGQRHGLPYQQASDALNGALKQAGIKLFIVAPEITKNSCDQTDTDTGTGSGTTTTSSDESESAPNSCDETGMDSGTTTTSSDQSETNSCDQTDEGTGNGIFPPTTPSDRSDTTTTTSSCDQMPPSCDQSSADTGNDTTTTTTTTSPTTTTSSDESDKTTTTSSCDETGTTGSCGPTSSTDQTGTATGATSSGGLTIRATGLHVVFRQPVNPPGVPAQYAEHILGEVFLDSLAVPAGPLGKLDLSSGSSCGGGSFGGTTSGGASTGGGSSLSSSGSTFGSTSQPTGSSTGTSLPAAFAAALRKPLWLLLAYVVWQALVIGTGWSLWNWRRGEAS